MSDQATLLLLEDKLERVRKTRTISTIAVFVVWIVSGFLIEWYYKFELIPGLLGALSSATLAAFIINGYYGVKEVRILRKIESLPKEGH